MTVFAFPSRATCARRILPPLLLAMMLLGVGTVAAVEVNVTVKPDGSFDPQWVRIRDGDTVAWRFPIPGLPPGTIGKTATTRAIIPVRPALRPQQVPSMDICTDYKPYDPGDPNEFTGPMPQAASGIFALGPDGPGFEEKFGESACNVCEANETLQALVGTGAGTRCLCETGKPYATMKETWEDPEITGVFIRLRWRDVHTGPGQFNWEVLDREIGRAFETASSTAWHSGRVRPAHRNGSSIPAPQLAYDHRARYPGARSRHTSEREERMVPRSCLRQAVRYESAHRREPVADSLHHGLSVQHQDVGRRRLHAQEATEVLSEADGGTRRGVSGQGHELSAYPGRIPQGQRLSANIWANPGWIFGMRKM